MVKFSRVDFRESSSLAGWSEKSTLPVVKAPSESASPVKVWLEQQKQLRSVASFGDWT